MDGLKQPNILIKTDFSWNARKSLLMYDTGGPSAMSPAGPLKESSEAHTPPYPLTLVTVSNGGTVYSVLIRGK